MTSARDTVVRLLAGLAARTGLPALRLDETGVCALAFDDAAVLHITPEEAAGAILFYARLGEIPHDRRAQMHRELLVANARGERLGSLAVDERDEAVLLVHRVAADGLDVAGFERLIEGLAAAALHWAAVLSQPAGVPPPKPADDGSLPMRFAIRG